MCWVSFLVEILFFVLSFCVNSDICSFFRFQCSFCYCGWLCWLCCLVLCSVFRNGCSFSICVWLCGGLCLVCLVCRIIVCRQCGSCVSVLAGVLCRKLGWISVVSCCFMLFRLLCVQFINGVFSCGLSLVMWVRMFLVSFSCVIVLLNRFLFVVLCCCVNVVGLWMLFRLLVSIVFIVVLIRFLCNCFCDLIVVYNNLVLGGMGNCLCVCLVLLVSVIFSRWCILCGCCFSVLL